MIHSSAPLRFTLLACVSLALCGIGLVAPGCGHGHGQDGAAASTGTIQVLNDCGSLRGIDSVEIEGPLGDVEHYDVVLAPSEAHAFEVDSGDYKVRVHWSNADVFVYEKSVGNGDVVQVQAVN